MISSCIQLSPLDLDPRLAALAGLVGGVCVQALEHKALSALRKCLQQELLHLNSRKSDSPSSVHHARGMDGSLPSEIASSRTPASEPEKGSEQTMIKVLEREPLDACRQQLLQNSCACVVEQVSLRKHSAAAGSPGPAPPLFGKLSSTWAAVQEKLCVHEMLRLWVGKGGNLRPVPQCVLHSRTSCV